jgi:ABC-type sugar transport system substrate-binding protein
MKFASIFVIAAVFAQEVTEICQRRTNVNVRDFADIKKVLFKVNGKTPVTFLNDPIKTDGGIEYFAVQINGKKGYVAADFVCSGIRGGPGNDCGPYKGYTLEAALAICGNEARCKTAQATVLPEFKSDCTGATVCCLARG